MTRWLPRIDFGPWGGGDLDGSGRVEGRSIVFQWGPIFFELCAGRVVR